jgi:acyl-CoA thioesterase-1
MKKEIENILVLGDSLGKGVVLDEAKKKYRFTDDCFVNLVQKSIRPCLYNASKFGTTVCYGRQVLERNLEKHRPDLVFIEYGGNDCDYEWDEIAKNPYFDHIPKTPLDLFERTLREIFGIVKDAGAIPVAMTLPPLNALNYFKWFTKGDAEKGCNILKWLEDVWRIYWWQERYSSAVMAVSEECGARCIDVRHAFLKKIDFRKFICEDGIHPNPSGHALIASEILAYIRNFAGYMLAANTPVPATV